MEQYDRIEKQKLWKLAQEGKSAEEMMEILDIRETASLELALDEVFREQGQTVHVPGLIGKASLKTRYTADGVRIEPAMLEGSTFRVGDVFDMKVDADRITLYRKKADAS